MNWNRDKTEKAARESMHHLLILSEKAQRYKDLIEKRGFPDLLIHAADKGRPPDHILVKTDIILGDPGRAAGVLSQTPRLRWLQSTFAGVDALTRPGLRTDYHLTGVKGVFGPLMSEYVFAYILSFERHVLETRDNQKKRVWRDIPYRRLDHLTLGLCGVGTIGRQIAVTARHFGMRTVGLKRTKEPVAEIDIMYSADQLQQFMRQPDYVIVTLPATPRTCRFIDGAALRCMKPSAVFMNIGRGAVVAEADLIQALELGWMRAAVLDVFEQEPLPADSPLWEMENVWITPHNSGKSFADDIATVFCDNYLRLIQDRPLKYMVNRELGY